MRTTVNIDDGLLETAKRRAKESGLTLGDFINAALQYYAGLEVPDPTTYPPLPVFRRGKGLKPGIDPTSNESLFDAAGDQNEEFARRTKKPVA